MYLIDGQRGGEKIGLLSLAHPGVVFPGKAGNVSGYRRGSRAVFRLKGIGVCLEQYFPLLCGDGVFVQLSCAQARDKGFIDAGCAQGLHGCGVGIPLIEIPHNADRLGVRGPDSKVHALFPAVGFWMRA